LSFDGRPTSRVAQESSGSWGAFLLVTYSLGKQRKVTRRKGEKPLNKEHSFTQILSHFGLTPPQNNENNLYECTKSKKPCIAWLFKHNN
jgi:hypothetical protein